MGGKQTAASPFLEEAVWGWQLPIQSLPTSRSKTSRKIFSDVQHTKEATQDISLASSDLRVSSGISFSYFLAFNYLQQC